MRAAIKTGSLYNGFPISISCDLPSNTNSTPKYLVKVFGGSCYQSKHNVKPTETCRKLVIGFASFAFKPLYLPGAFPLSLVSF